MNRETKRPRIIFLGAASLFGTNHRMLMVAMIAVTVFYIVLMFFAKEIKLEKAKQEDLTVSTRTDRDGNKDTGIFVI